MVKHFQTSISGRESFRFIISAKSLPILQKAFHCGFFVRLAEELEVHTRQIPALSTQLNIITTVKTATPESYSSDVVIVTNAERLLDAVMHTLNAAETLCVKVRFMSPWYMLDQKRMKVIDLFPPSPHPPRPCAPKSFTQSFRNFPQNLIICLKMDKPLIKSNFQVHVLG